MNGRSSKLDDRLRGVDRLCERWVGEAYRWRLSPAMHPMWRGERGSGDPPTVSDEVMLLDKVLAQSDPHYRALLTIWYAYDTPIEVKAWQFGVGRTKMYEIWKQTLEYLRGALTAHGLRI